MKFYEQDKIYSEIYDIIYEGLYSIDQESDHLTRKITENIINSEIFEVRLK